MDKQKNFISGVVYVHNAENRIEKFLSNLITMFEKNFDHSEIICVNDDSSDDSGTIVKKVSKQASSMSISLINMSYFHGLEVSMNAGMDLSIGDFVFEFDNTNLDFDNKQIMDAYYKSLKGYDIVSVVPNGKESFTSKLFYKVFDKYTKLSYKMHTERFRILSRRVINRVGSMNKTVPYRKAIYANQGLKSTYIKYEPTNNEVVRKDKQEKRFRFRLASDALILFTDLGYKFSVAMTVLMMLISIFMIVYSTVVFTMSKPVAGWTTTMLFLSIAFLGLFGILTVIIKYLQLLINLVFKRKNYSFESIEKLTK